MKFLFNAATFISMPLLMSSASATMKLTSATFRETVESGQNGMIKFFQPWCGHCTAMKPAWDALAETADPSVFIADVDCSEEADLCAMNGVNGYPTITYYKDGQSDNYSGGRSLEELSAFVTENLGKACNPNGDIKELCSEKAQKYIKKWKEREDDDIKKEIKRLKGMLEKSMTNELKTWAKERMFILKQMVPPDVTLVDRLTDAKDTAVRIISYGMAVASAIADSVLHNALDFKDYVTDLLFPDPRVEGYSEEWKAKKVREIKSEVWSLQQSLREDISSSERKWTEKRIKILKELQVEEKEL